MPGLPVLDSTLHHRESGDPVGLPFVFLHGNSRHPDGSCSRLPQNQLSRGHCE
ncbi:hypothetical protein ACRJ4B_07730 [Streptomyces sp. GTA36]